MFEKTTAKGLNSLIYANGASKDDLTVHISEIGPGTRAHPPHVHQGTECFLALEGKGRVEMEGENIELSAGEAVILDASVEHGFVNIGDSNLKYVVIIAPRS